MLRSVNRLKSFVTTFRIVSVRQNLNFICFSAEPIIFNVFFVFFEHTVWLDWKHFVLVEKEDHFGVLKLSDFLIQ